MASKRPTNKVVAGALGGGIAAVLMGLLAMFFPDRYAMVPPGFEAGIATIIGTLLAYVVPDARPADPPAP